VAQEDCCAEGAGVWFPTVKAVSHVRGQGEELRSGALLLDAGQRLCRQGIGLLASIGMAQVPVYRRLRIGLLSSGDELREPDQTLAPG
jgi:molybdopterin molybdotransferase